MSRCALLIVVTLSLFAARDAPARTWATAHRITEAVLSALPRQARLAAWANALEGIEVKNASTGVSARICLYDRTGEVDPDARAAFERVASRDPEPHALSARTEQLVFKAAYHFGASRVIVVSGWRAHAGKHTAGDAVDFRLAGVYAGRVAAYLRSLPRVGVGLYTNPGTQFVHVDDREPSFHWVDASPPGVHWPERAIGNAHGAQRDATYEPAVDLPL